MCKHHVPVESTRIIKAQGRCIIPLTHRSGQTDFGSRSRKSQTNPCHKVPAAMVSGPCQPSLEPPCAALHLPKDYQGLKPSKITRVFIYSNMARSHQSLSLLRICLLPPALHAAGVLHRRKRNPANDGGLTRRKEPTRSALLKFKPDNLTIYVSF